MLYNFSRHSIKLQSLRLDDGMLGFLEFISLVYTLMLSTQNLMGFLIL